MFRIGINAFFLTIIVNKSGSYPVGYVPQKLQTQFINKKRTSQYYKDAETIPFLKIVTLKQCKLNQSQRYYDFTKLMENAIKMSRYAPANIGNVLIFFKF